MHGVNLGTLLRTCDAVGACLAVPRLRSAGYRVVGVELADEAIRLADLPAARQRTIAVLGHEQTGIPAEALHLLDAAIEIPMIGTGASLNVAVAGSLVLYRLAGFL
jgi:tRNA (guanosine-2'-O-)-methyltransferase